MRRVVSITGTRADYGLMEPVHRAIAEDPELELHLIVTGMHLLPEFGSSLEVVRRFSGPVPQTQPCCPSTAWLATDESPTKYKYKSERTACVAMRRSLAATRSIMPLLTTVLPMAESPRHPERFWQRYEIATAR